MRKYFCIALFSLLILTCDVAFARSPARNVKEGNESYEKKDYGGSIQKYKQALEKAPESDVVNYDLGTAYYKHGDYNKAMPYFQKSLLSDDETLRTNAHFNIGNTFYKAGMQQKEKEIDKAIDSLKQSLVHFERVLNVNDKDGDAKYNYDFVKKELEKLIKQKKKQEQQKKKQEPQKQQQKKQGQNEQQQQQQQEKQEQHEKNKQNNAQQQSAGNQEQQPREQQGAPNNTEKGKMTKKEAEMMLRNYKQNEEPEGLLNLMKHKWQERPVLKDW